MPRIDRSLSGAHEALRNTPRRNRPAPSQPTWSLKVTTVLRWLVAGVLILVSLSLFGDAALDALRRVIP